MCSTAVNIALSVVLILFAVATGVTLFIVLHRHLLRYVLSNVLKKHFRFSECVHKGMLLLFIPDISLICVLLHSF